jgi:hypothetical protein
LSRADKRLNDMRRNPRDWRVEDIASVCTAFGVDFSPPGSGSHWKVKHPAMPEILTIPSRRPIKPVYIRALVAFIDRVREAGQ